MVVNDFRTEGFEGVRSELSKTDGITPDKTDFDRIISMIKMNIVKTTKVSGLLAKLTRTFIGAVDDVAEVSLVRCGANKYNLKVNYSAIKFGDPKEVYLFPEPVDEEVAIDKYNKITIK